VGKETSNITNVFRQADLKIPFRTNNTIGNLLGHKIPTPDKFSLSGVYKLTCPDCNKAYVGQTGRHFSFVTTSTRKCSITIATHPVSHNTFTSRHIPLAPLTILCRSYTTTRKEPT
jgi:hypothetical protein